MDATTAAEHLIDGAPARHRHRVGALSILFVWAFYFALNTMRMSLAGPYHQLAMCGRRAAVTIFGMGLTWVLYFVIRRVDRAGMPVRLAVAFTASVPVALGHAAFNYYAFYVYAPIDFWPLEPIGLFFHEIGASAKAPHPNAARLAVNFMLSQEGQRKTTTWGRLPVRRDVETNPPGVLDAFRGKAVIPITLAGEAEKKADGLYKELVAGRAR